MDRPYVSIPFNREGVSELMLRRDPSANSVSIPFNREGVSELLETLRRIRSTFIAKFLFPSTGKAFLNRIFCDD